MTGFSQFEWLIVALSLALWHGRSKARGQLGSYAV
jgi:hypothetical protein